MKNRWNLMAFPALLAAVVLSGCAMAQSGAMDIAHRRIEQGRYQAALSELAQAEGYRPPKPALEAQIVFLKGTCYEGLKQPAQARALFQYVADHFADTEYGYLAKAKLSVSQDAPTESSSTNGVLQSH